MERHAEAGLPNEACGMLLGTVDGPTYHVRDAILTPNRMKSPARFAIPDGDILRAYQTAGERGMDVVGVYHSHPSSPAIPSETDARYMDLNPGAWVIYSGIDGRMRAWIRDDSMAEMHIRIDTDA
jgi:proteasome lid subunit RPN8/RPN11